MATARDKMIFNIVAIACFIFSFFAITPEGAVYVNKDAKYPWVNIFVSMISLILGIISIYFIYAEDIEQEDLREKVTYTLRQKKDGVENGN